MRKRIFNYKRDDISRHQGKMSPKHLEYYLDEFAFRINRKIHVQGKIILQANAASGYNTICNQ